MKIEISSIGMDMDSNTFKPNMVVDCKLYLDIELARDTASINGEDEFSLMLGQSVVEAINEKIQKSSPS